MQWCILLIELLAMVYIPNFIARNRTMVYIPYFIASNYAMVYITN